MTTTFTVLCDGADGSWGGIEEDTYILTLDDRHIARLSRDYGQADRSVTWRYDEIEAGWLVDYDHLLIDFLTFLREVCNAGEHEFASAAFSDDDGNEVRHPFATDNMWPPQGSAVASLDVETTSGSGES